MMNKTQHIRPWTAAVWLALWQGAAMALHEPLALVSPLRVLKCLGTLVGEGPFWRTVGTSSLRILLGFLLAAAAGTALALLAARWRAVEQLLCGPMVAMRSVPVASFTVLALMLFSVRSLSVLISFLMVLPIFYSGVLEGIGALDGAMAEMAQVFALPPLRRVRYVYLPQILPYVRAAAVSSLGLCWKAGIAAEVIGMPPGSIGAQLYRSKVYLDTPELFAWTLVIVALSMLFERLALWLLGQAARLSERM